MDKQLESKLKDLPTSPGVYFHKNKSGEIIYVGKAANLRSRVHQYFQKSRYRDPKTDILVSEIVDVEWIELESEADALFLEAELIRRYQSPYNIMLRDDKSLQFVRIDYKSDYPTVTLMRGPLDDGAEYFGPYINGFAVKRALRYLRRAFPYATNRPIGQKRANLHYHLGLDPGLEEGRTSLEEYRANLRKLMQYLRGHRVTLTREIEREMKKAAKAQEFEKAAHLRNQLSALRQLSRQVLFSDRENLDTNRDQALDGLTKLLDLKQPLRHIEGFDISHMQASDTVASMVVFTNGAPDKTAYRKFKMRKPGNDDFEHIYETLSRRLSETNRTKWGLPALMLIDGGKGQLRTGLRARDEAGLSAIPMIGLAKRQEEIIISKVGSVSGGNIPKIIKNAKSTGAYVVETADFLNLSLPLESPVVKLLQRIRDESHRFAVSYHSSLKRTRQTTSVLDNVPGIGPTTRKKLIRHFGSARAVSQATPDQLQEVVGPKLSAVLAAHILANR